MNFTSATRLSFRFSRRLALVSFVALLSIGCGSPDDGGEQMSEDEAATAFEYLTAPLVIEQMELATRAIDDSSGGEPSSISYETDCPHDGTAAFDGRAAAETGGPFILDSTDFEVSYDKCAPVAEFPNSMQGTIDWTLRSEQEGEDVLRTSNEYDGDIEFSGDQLDGECRVRVTQIQSNDSSDAARRHIAFSFEGTICGYDASEVLGHESGWANF